jgi:hypothetical protein
VKHSQSSDVRPKERDRARTVALWRQVEVDAEEREAGGRLARTGSEPVDPAFLLEEAQQAAGTLVAEVVGNEARGLEADGVRG